jgi:hypothetical protein
MSIAAITSAVSQNQSLASLFSVNRINPISGKDADGDDHAQASGVKSSGNAQKDKLGKLNQAVLQTVAQMIGNTQTAALTPSVAQSKNGSTATNDQSNQLKQGVDNFVQTLFDALNAKEGTNSQASSNNAVANAYQANEKTMDMKIQGLAQDVLNASQGSSQNLSQKITALQSSAYALLASNNVAVNGKSASDLLQGIGKLLEGSVLDAGSVINAKA